MSMLKMPLPWSPCLPLYYAHVEIISLKKLTKQLNCQIPRFEVILAPLEILLLQQKWPLAPFCNEHMPLVRSSSLAIWSLWWQMKHETVNLKVRSGSNGLQWGTCLGHKNDQLFEFLWAAFEAVLGARMHYGHPDIMNKLLGEKDMAGPVKICENTFKHIWDPCDTMNIPHVFGSTKRLNISQLHLNEWPIDFESSKTWPVSVCFRSRLFMMQQGGVSKATKTVNLSEDIFAGGWPVTRCIGDCACHDIDTTDTTSTPRTGMDFTLRGNGRTIKFLSINLAQAFFT